MLFSPELHIVPHNNLEVTERLPVKVAVAAGKSFCFNLLQLDPWTEIKPPHQSQRSKHTWPWGMLSSARIGTVRPFLTNQPGISIKTTARCANGRVIKKFAVPPIEVVELGTNVSQPAHHLCFWVPLRFCNCIISCPAHIIVLKPCLSVWGRFIVSRYQILGGWRLRSADHFFLSFFLASSGRMVGLLGPGRRNNLERRNDAEWKSGLNATCSAIGNVNG